MPRERANILMIMADQLPAWATGTYGHPLVHTPGLNRLAESGAVFESAYANCPLCAPSRASMCSGRFPSTIGAFDNGAEFCASVPTFVHHLRRAGYESLLSGKMHFIGPDQMHGFERRLTPDIYPSSFAWTPDWTKGAYGNSGTAVDQLRYAGLCKWSMQMDYDEEVHFRGLEALRDLARRRGQGRPFFLCVSYTHPHDPFVITQPWWDLYDHEAIDMPSAPPVPLEQMHPYDRWLQVHHMVDRFPPDEHQVRNARHAFYGMVSYFDAKVSELTAELERLGMSEDTIVVVTSDHGEMLGEHGMWLKRTYFEESVRVPLLISGPDIAGGERIVQTVSLVDLYPTFLEFGCVADREEYTRSLDGESLCGLLRGDCASWKDYAVAEYCGEGVCQPMRMAMRGGLKYVYVHGEAPMLFDLALDPHELHNRFDDPVHSEQIGELKALAHRGWDPEELRARVIESQKSRRIINQALQEGTGASWDVQPQFDARRQYVRRFDAKVTSELLRLPERE